jgi:hypothetical protein
VVCLQKVREASALPPRGGKPKFQRSEADEAQRFHQRISNPEAKTECLAVHELLAGSGCLGHNRVRANEGAKTCAYRCAPQSRWADMSGFSSRDDLQRLADDAVVAYTERVRLMSQLITFQPRLTAMEMAVLYGYVVCAELEAEQKTAQKYVGDTDASEAAKLFNEVRSEFFKTICQDYITKICRSDLNLEVHYQQIGENLTPVLNAISADRRKRAFELIFAVANNALQLAGCTIAILRSRLDRNQEIVTKRYAATLVAADPSLNALEKKKAIEWISGSSWVLGAS